MIKFIPTMCPCCSQSTTYVLAIDKGTVDIVKKIALFIGQKGINVVHPRKEMEGTYLTSNQVGNLSRARFHGLIAAVRSNPGNYLLTRKGAQFLHGESIPKYAVISKAEGCQIGYFDEEKERCVVYEFADPKLPYWEGLNYTISEGEVITKLSTGEASTKANAEV